MKIYGKNACLEALRAGIRAEQIYIENKADEELKNEILSLAKTAQIKYCKKDLLNKMSDFKNHQGILMFCENFKYKNLEDVLNKQNEDLFLLILDNIEDPQNLGNLIRTAECAGVNAIIIPKDRACSVNETVFKVSAGAISHIDICRVTNINDTIKTIKKQNIFVYGLEADGTSIYKSNLTGKIALVVGSEGKGISQLTKKNCDEILSIPLKGQVNSLNASNAGAIGMFEALRQREKWSK